MRLTHWVVVAAVSCGGQSGTANVTVSQKSGVTPLPIAVPPHKLGLPKDAAVVAVFDVTAMKGLLGDVESAMEKELGTSHLEELGIDRSRPIAVAIMSANDAQRRLLDEIRPLTESKTPSPQATDLITHLHARDPVPPTRVLLPATDGAKLEANLVARLKGQDWHDFNGGLVHGSQVVLIHHDATTVALDFCGRQTAPFEGDEPVPPLEGRVARVTWSPSAVASFGVLATATVVAGAISGESLDAATRARIAAAGLWEAGRNFALAGNASGAFFDRIDASLRLAPFELTVRARPGPAFTLPPPDAWRPSSSVAIDGTWADLDGASALSHAWPFPSDVADILTLTRDGGTSAWLVALPHLLESAPLVAAKAWSLPDAGPLTSRFERAGFAWTEGHELAFGLLPAKTTRAQAECVLSGPPCPAEIEAEARRHHRSRRSPRQAARGQSSLRRLVRR